VTQVTAITELEVKSHITLPNYYHQLRLMAVFFHVNLKQLLLARIFTCFSFFVNKWWEARSPSCHPTDSDKSLKKTKQHLLQPVAWSSPFFNHHRTTEALLPLHRLSFATTI